MKRINTLQGRRYVRRPKYAERMVSVVLFILTTTITGTLYFTRPSLPQVIVQASEGVRDAIYVDTTNVGTESANISTPSATPKSEKEQIIDYIKEVFGEDAERALGVAKCESGMRAKAINDKNRNGTTDYGVFQINSVHLKRYGSGFTTDWKENVRVAHKIFIAHGDSFRPWVCAKSIGEKNYLGQ